MISEKLILLRKTRYRDSDLILHGLNGKGAKVSLLARGALRSKKRFGGGVLDPPHYVNSSYKESKKEGALGVLEEASLINDFSGLKKDYDRIELALHMVSLVDRMAQEGDIGSENIFHLLGNSLRTAEVSSNIPFLRVQFEGKLLYYFGVLPQVSEMNVLLEANVQDHENLGVEPSQINRWHRQFREIFENYSVRLEGIVR